MKEKSQQKKRKEKENSDNNGVLEFYCCFSADDVFFQQNRGKMIVSLSGYLVAATVACGGGDGDNIGLIQHPASIGWPSEKGDLKDEPFHCRCCCRLSRSDTDLINIICSPHSSATAIAAAAAGC